MQRPLANLLNIADEQIIFSAKFSYNISQLKFMVSEMKHATQRYKQTMFEVLTIITTIERRKKKLMYRFQDEVRMIYFVSVQFKLVC